MKSFWIKSNWLKGSQTEQWLKQCHQKVFREKQCCYVRCMVRCCCFVMMTQSRIAPPMKWKTNTQLSVHFISLVFFFFYFSKHKHLTASNIVHAIRMPFWRKFLASLAQSIQPELKWKIQMKELSPTEIDFEYLASFDAVNTCDKVFFSSFFFFILLPMAILLINYCVKMLFNHFRTKFENSLTKWIIFYGFYCNINFNIV